ncbi:Uncharacterised protein [Providencia rustigianii]|uniref:Uncharacterized protein n=2 Tax=Providencia rustigianii TaxID=158850 RepID=D1P755_9GAMM|nr:MULTISPECIES: hypothetical protein [Providencia]EFB70902.1 hypothetical protein PROVRUST_08075 [Providencia rustigianii DSM 4541]MTC56280.1 hypothetical protein [Providencia rustigianii]MTC59829.1 hypothetical protein [Providencia rustigianii]SPY76333.1 Uncharacterised protein [Providencia rustigianii]SUC34299.1 Uncharacterised protein [Providencia rustigianii]
MSTYCFFTKSDEVVALDVRNTERVSALLQAGYQRQFEELEANSEELAVKRFASIRSGEEQSVSESVFHGLITSFLSR